MPISFTLNKTSSLLKTVLVPMENKKERNMIIEYDAKKNLPFNSSFCRVLAKVPRNPATAIDPK